MNAGNQNTNPQNLRPQKRKNPLGVFFVLLLLGLVVLGVYYFWQQKQNGGNMGDFLSSLKLPQMGGSNSTTNVELDGNPQQQTFTQQQPFNPPQQRPRRAKGNIQQHNEPKHLIGRQDLATQQPYAPRGVESGYPYNQPQIDNQAPRGKDFIASKNFIPKDDFVSGSLDSFIAYNGTLPQDKMAPKPDQIISFKTKAIAREKALLFTNAKLNSLGFTDLTVPIDDYNKGGKTIIAGKNAVDGRKIYLGFKKNFEKEQTEWKIEIYR
jgi:hypothetical protein